MGAAGGDDAADHWDELIGSPPEARRPGGPEACAD
jgi:hypothetical protein